MLNNRYPEPGPWHILWQGQGCIFLKSFPPPTTLFPRCSLFLRVKSSNKMTEFASFSVQFFIFQELFKFKFSDLFNCLLLRSLLHEFIPNGNYNLEYCS